ncbi:MAG: hypothetical protein ACI3X9_02040 [Bacteroidaceae bacterium]
MRKGRKPITLPAGILILLFTLMPLGGCQQDNGDFQRQLSAADSLMQTDADSAFRMLCAMDSQASRMPKALQMEHLLLRCNAQNKADSLFSSDSLGLLLTRYFDRKGTPNQRMLAHYILGCAYRDMGDSPSALRCFNEAVAAADTSDANCNIRQLYLAHCQIAQIFMNRCLADEAIQAFECAEYCATQINDQAAIYTIWSLLSDAFIIKGDIEKSLEMKEKSARGFCNLGYSQLAAQTVGTCVEWLARRGEFSKAKSYMEEYVRYSGYFDEKGNAYPGSEICNTVRTIYYTESGHLDSAFYYLHQTAMAPMDADTHYLYSILARDYYLQLGDIDSIAKYSLSCNHWSDSLRRLQDVENLQLLQAQFNYSRYIQKTMQHQMENLQLRNNLLQTVVLFVLFILAVLLSSYLYVRFIRKEVRGLLHKYHASMNEKQQILLSSMRENDDLLQQIEDSNQTIHTLKSEISQKAQMIASLYEQLALSSIQEDSTIELQKKIRQQQQAIEELNERCETYKQDLDHMLSVKKRSDLLREPSVRSFVEQEQSGARKPSEEQWAAAILTVEEYYPRMKDLRLQYNLSTMDYRISILIKLGVSLYNIMQLTDKSNAYLSTSRSRLYTRIHHIKGGAKDFDQYIQQL